ncbi:hypothetical protein SFC07_11190 [Corynebacterium callunae]|uniref:hypothetical protein n=1 Tax=Corynebacterium callunae TaxID=1721 RepID=UPI0039823E08
MYTIFDLPPVFDPAVFSEMLLHNAGVLSAGIGAFVGLVYFLPAAAVGSMMSSMGLY